MDEYLHGWERGYAAAMGLWDDALAARAVRELQSVGGYKKTEIEGLRRGFLALFLARGHPTARFFNHMSAVKGDFPPPPPPRRHTSRPRWPIRRRALLAASGAASC